jgi:Zn-dependent M28 family amino/carboxypeptidase
MDCNCISRHGQALTEQLLAKGAVNPRVFASFVGMDFESETGSMAVLMTFTAHAENKPYSGAKGHPMSVIASFCPFCGTPAKAGAAIQPAPEAPCV